MKKLFLFILILCLAGCSYNKQKQEYTKQDIVKLLNQYEFDYTQDYQLTTYQHIDSIIIVSVETFYHQEEKQAIITENYYYDDHQLTYYSFALPDEDRSDSSKLVPKTYYASLDEPQIHLHDVEALVDDPAELSNYCYSYPIEENKIPLEEIYQNEYDTFIVEDDSIELRNGNCITLFKIQDQEITNYMITCPDQSSKSICIYTHDIPSYEEKIDELNNIISLTINDVGVDLSMLE